MTDTTSALAEEPTRPPRWGLGDAVLGFLIALTGSQIVLALILVVTNRSIDEVDDMPLSLVAIAQVGLWVGLLGVPLIATRLKGGGLVRDLHLRVRGADAWRGGVVGVLLQLVALPLLYWPLLDVLGKDASELEGPARAMTDRADGLVGVVLLVLIVGVGAPIVEEIFYRGLLQGALLKRGFRPAAAITLSATVFGVSHFALLQLPALVLFGAVAGVLAHRAGRLGPAIAAHVTFNMVTVVSLLVAS